MIYKEQLVLQWHESQVVKMNCDLKRFQRNYFLSLKGIVHF